MPGRAVFLIELLTSIATSLLPLARTKWATARAAGRAGLVPDRLGGDPARLVAFGDPGGYCSDSRPARRHRPARIIPVAIAEDRLKAIRREGPQFIPAHVSLLPATWKRHGAGLDALVARYPALFGLQAQSNEQLAQALEEIGAA